eukprot:CAMPEP_0180525456 /NCGR_PEP_ID=MMETSP1036_2-20121128/59175_1 /TAXON_ID=632150 /ORGANISM="Azadinium spinosum, Strain 3D9" /LENGTH=86 /DNA_ID=CAMNT_0022538751 /DNA_START=176 /DNA_END=433 /DNA_ORIENTATION=+
MRAYHFPGLNGSYIERGADFHQGEYKQKEEVELVDLVKSKLLLLGPPASNQFASSSSAQGSSGARREVVTTLTPSVGPATVPPLAE